MLTLDTIGDFTWSYHYRFHISTANGNYEWSCPDYPGGDNTIRPAKPYRAWLSDQNLPYGREKGKHTIREYCGDDVIILEK